MKNKLHTILVIVLMVGTLLMCMTGCRGNEPGQSTETTQPAEQGGSMTVVGGEKTDSGLQEGSFEKSNQMNQIISNAKELGGSKTLDIEFPEEETYPDQGDAEATEPQWHPGVW